MPPVSFRERLRSGPPLVLDAALGTELLLRGAKLPPPLWSAQALLDRPDLVEKIHRENAEAGADVLTIASFRLHARNIRESSCSLSQGELIARAVTLARNAASEISSPIAIAGSLAPLEDCFQPARVPKQENILFSEHAEMAFALARAGVDLILVETMNTIREALAAARGAAATGLPVVASCVTDGNGRLLSGEPVEDFARALLALPRPPDALGINCVAASALGPDLARLARAASGAPLAAYGNTFSEAASPQDYAALAGGWITLGARLVGGCCGTAAAHTRALRSLLQPP
ncbi:MAG TPA: homocysteine S-methyltransferase family protein [Thermoanaerobaculia bacterium]|nr:homocysteine S-methyltransferase family protein [Thermoanaerobaculia bacterium]